MDTDDAKVLLAGWGRTPRAGTHVREPQNVDQLRDLVANRPPRGLICRGLGRSYGDAAQNAGGMVVVTTGLRQVLDINLGDATVTCQAGVSLETLLQALVPLGLFIPVSPGTRFVTVGGAICADIHGKNHHVDGAFCDYVTSMTLLLPSGETLVVTPSSHPDIFAATRGGMGLTGIVLQATIRMLPIETSQIAVDTERAGDFDDLLTRMEDSDDRYRYSVAWVDCLASGPSLGRAVLTRGNHMTRAELPDDSADPRHYEASTPRQAPDWFPSRLLNRLTVRTFNELWFRKAPYAERGRPWPIPRFFHPLDGIGDWNRLYGRGGFLQYQVVVPRGRERVLQRIVEAMSSSRCPSFVPVLKRMGPGRGMLSFPIEGWTLAVDIPAYVPGLKELLDGFDDGVADAGGRVYLAKDSRLAPDKLKVMYPQLGEWRQVRQQVDPDGMLTSDLARRLEIA